MIRYNQYIQGGLNKVSIQVIQQAICYMEEHICENISYAEVAKKCICQAIIFIGHSVLS